MEKDTHRPDPTTRYSGYHLGIRRKLAVSVQDAWDYFCSAKGLNVWIEGPCQVHADQEIELPDGTRIVWKAVNARDSLAFAYRLPDWSSFSNVQIRFLPKEDVLLLHVIQENIPDIETRNHLSNRLAQLVTNEKICPGD